MECGCGRSPTGKCIGWHALSEEEYQNELVKFESGKEEENSEDPGQRPFIKQDHMAAPTP